MLGHIARSSFVAVLFTMLAAVPAHAAHPIYNPSPISVPAGKGIEHVKKAIRKACFDKGWEVREIAAGQMQAKYSKSGRRGATHIAVVNIRYDAKRIRISYKGSQDLDYDAGAGTIHGTYNRWVQNLERNIRANLGAF